MDLAYSAFGAPLWRQSLRRAYKLVAALPGGRMHRLLTTLGRGFKKRIGWERLGIAGSPLIIAFAFTAPAPTPKGRDTRLSLTARPEIPPAPIGFPPSCVLGPFRPPTALVV